MEKSTESKEVKEQVKLTYEQLKELADQLHQQNQMMRKKLMEAANIDAYKRIDYLFKVLENHRVFNIEFVKSTAIELESILKLQEEEAE